MTTVSILDIIKSTKIILDEDGVSNSVLPLSGDQLQLDDIIRSKIVESVKQVHLSASDEFLDLEYDFSGNNTVTNQDGTGYIQLPENYLRLVVFKISNWRRPVIHTITDTDPLYSQQKSRFSGIRGNADKPVCAITRNKTGKILEFYSANPQTKAQIDLAYCLQTPQISTDNKINICGRLLEAVYYYCAALTCTSIGETEKAKTFFELSKTNYERA